jgi:hypothetical protein
VFFNIYPEYLQYLKWRKTLRAFISEWNNDSFVYKNTCNIEDLHDVIVC